MIKYIAQRCYVWYMIAAMSGWFTPIAVSLVVGALIGKYVI